MVQAHLVLSQTQFISPRSTGSQSGEWYSEAKTWVLGVLVAVGMLLLPGPFRGWSYGREQLSCTTVGNMCVFLHIMSIYTCVHSSIYLSIHPSVCEFNRNFPFHSPAQFHLVLSLFIVVTPFSDGEETTPIIFNILLYVTSLPPLPPPTTSAPSSLPGLGTPLQAPAATFLHRMLSSPAHQAAPPWGHPFHLTWSSALCAATTLTPHRLTSLSGLPLSPTPRRHLFRSST